MTLPMAPQRIQTRSFIGRQSPLSWKNTSSCTGKCHAGAAYFLKFKKKKPGTKGSADLDNYDYGGEDDDAMDEPEDSEDE